MDYVCYYCGSKDVIFDSRRSETRCKLCGMVLSENIINLELSGDNNVNSVSYGKNSTVSCGKKELLAERRLRKNIGTLSPRERSLAIALNILNRNASVLGLPKVIKEDVKYYYIKAMKGNLIRGRSIEGVVAALLFTTCKMSHIPRSLDEISEITGVDRRSISRINSVIVRELDIKMPPSNPTDFIPRFVSLLELPKEVEVKAIEIIYEASNKNLISGKDPVSIAAAALYMASVLCDVKKSQKEISEVTSISDVTIRARYKELAKELDLKIDV